MLSGDAKTATFTTAHAHPTNDSLFEPLSASKETAVINPNPPPLNSTINFAVKIRAFLGAYITYIKR